MKAISHNTPSIKIKTLILALNLLFIAFCASDVEAQNIRKITNKVPKHLPIKVEIINDDKDDVLREAEIKVTNISDKPIYYLYFILQTVDVKSPRGKNIAFLLRFGRTELIDIDNLAEKDDIAILPNKSYILKVPAKIAEGFEKRDGVWKDIPKPKKFRLLFQVLSFGDGTGFLDTEGSPVPSSQSKDLKEENSLSPPLAKILELNSLIVNFINQNKGCSNNQNSSFFLTSLNYKNSLSCACGQAPDGTTCDKVKFSGSIACCMQPPYETQPDISYGSCSDTSYPCRRVIWTNDVQCSNGDCCCEVPTLVACSSTICTSQGDEVCTGGVDEDCDDKIDCADDHCGDSPDCVDECDKDRDTHIAESCGGDDCVDDPSINPNASSIYPGATELCSGGEDEDCDDKTDCRDGDCSSSTQCPECADKDGDGFIPQSCEGLDCVDDPSVNPNAANINPGVAEDCTTQEDDDCNGFPNCIDSACNGNSACNVGGGSNYNYQQCYDYYLVTTYYRCIEGYCEYLYETWDYIGTSCGVSY